MNALHIIDRKDLHAEKMLRHTYVNKSVSSYIMREVDAKIEFDVWFIIMACIGKHVKITLGD